MKLTSLFFAVCAFAVSQLFINKTNNEIDPIIIFHVGRLFPVKLTRWL